MTTDWGTNVGAMLAGLLIAGFLGITARNIVKAFGLSEPFLFLSLYTFGIIGFFAVMYIYYRIFLDKNPIGENI